MTLHIETENEAFEGENEKTEVARLLRKIAKQIEDGREFGKIIDINGNSVGEFAF